MAFNEIKENTEQIQDQLSQLVDAKLEYYKLRSFKMAMKSTTTIIKFTVILLFAAMVLLFCSIALAFAIGKYFDSFALGFLTVGGIYFVVTVLLYILKDHMVERPILERFSDIFFNN